REQKRDMIPLVRRLLADPDAAVLRESAIALRYNKAPGAAEQWAGLARRYQGDDRWYLEALGIGADKQWDTYLEAFLKTASLAADSRARHDIIWRSRASRTSALLAEIIRDPKTMVPELPRYF